MDLKTAVTLSLLVAALQTAAKASELRGRVIDAKFRPVAGARVDIATAAPKKGQGMFCPSCYLDCR